jgi:hypothetical protein
VGRGSQRGWVAGVVVLVLGIGLGVALLVAFPPMDGVRPTSTPEFAYVVILDGVRYPCEDFEVRGDKVTLFGLYGFSGYDVTLNFTELEVE